MRCSGNDTIIGEREKIIHEYLANLSRSIGFAEEELVSLYDLPGILSFPKGIAWMNIFREYQMLCVAALAPYGSLVRPG